MDYSKASILVEEAALVYVSQVALLRGYLLGLLLCWKFDLLEGMEQQVEVFVELSYQRSLAWECLTS